MSVLSGKKVLLFSQFFFGYEKIIANKMKDLGAEVALYDEMSIKKPLERAILKISPILFSFRTNQYYKSIINLEREISYDYVLFIDCEMPTELVMRECRKAFPNAKLCLHLWDSVENLKGIVKKFKYFDYISSFDKEDAQQYDLTFRPLFFGDDYRVKREDVSLDEYEYDLSFIGTIHSDRYDIINKLNKVTAKMYVYPYLQSKFIYFFYRIIKKEFRNSRITDFEYSKLDSKTIAGIVERSKAILDIQHPNQTGLTIRTIEMLGMKKKIITTNADIKNYDFYNANNICIIDRQTPYVPDMFYSSNYEEIPENIYEYYSIDSWIWGVLGIGNG